MIRETISALQSYQAQTKAEKVAPHVLMAGLIRAHKDERGVFWIPDLARGKDRITSGSTQPWVLLRAAGVLLEREHIVTESVPPETNWETLPSYQVTDLGKLACARMPEEMIPTYMPKDLREELRAVNAANTIVNAGN